MLPLFCRQMLSRPPPVALRDIAVLYRTNAQSMSLEEAFKEAGVPYTVKDIFTLANFYQVHMSL
eukprot:scaffold3324_cov28-Tisochrysis_lutea.AAC.1